MSTTKNLNRGLALALILTLILCLLPVAAHAFSGTGTQSDPYIIANASDLATFRSNVNGGTSYSGVYFKLTADITTAQTAVIGTSSTYPFAGTFDGDGHTINVNLSGASRTALFGYVTGTIQNLIVTGSVTSTGSYSGGVVGYLYDGSVLNCGNEASVSATGGYSGGVVGYTGGTCTIDGCYNTGAISGGTRIGGIVGEQYTNVTVSNCYNLGSISGTSSSNGGVVGYGRGPVSNCYHAVGSVSTSYNGGSVGAIVGYMYSSGSMTNCYYVAVPSSLKGNSAGTAGTELTVAQMKAAASSLGNYYEADSNNVNSGYPILYWQGSGSTPSTGIVDALNDLMDDYGDSILVWYDDEYSDSYDSGDTIYNDSIYLEPMELTDCTLDNETGDVYAIWTSSSAAVTVPSDGYGEATVTHSTSQVLSVTMTARLTTVIDNVIYTSTDYVSYNFTISRDEGAAVTYTVYVSIFNNKNAPNNVILSGNGRNLIAVPVTVSGYANTICVDDALQQLHTDYYNGNNGYITSNGMITKLWGIENNNNFGIFRNDTLTTAVTQEPISNGDMITAFTYKNTGSSNADRYLLFENRVTAMLADDTDPIPVSLSTYFKTYINSTATSVSGSSYEVYKLNPTTGALDSATGEVSINNGNAIVDPSANGTYVLLATHAREGNFLTGYKYYVPGVALLKVGMSNAAAIAADKAALTISTGANNTIVSYANLPTTGANGSTITWSSSPTGIILLDGQVIRPDDNTQVTLTATISKGDATPQTKMFYVNVPEKVDDFTLILPTLATALTPNSANVTSSNIEDYLWNIVDVIAYENETTSPNAYITASEKASYYNYAVSYVQSVISGSGSNAEKSNDLCKAIMLLKALNYDNSGTNSGYSIGNISSITYNNMTKSIPGWLEYFAGEAIGEAQLTTDYLHTLAFVLAADLEEPNLASSTFIETVRDTLINEQTTIVVDNETQGKWTGIIDEDEMIMSALGFYLNYKQSINPNFVDTDIVNAFEYSFNYLSDQQQANGSLGFGENAAIGNANSTAFGVIALAAMGEDPETFNNASESIVEGLLTYYNASTELFQYNGADNALATEQAFRALVAVEAYRDVAPNRFVIYEF